MASAGRAGRRPRPRDMEVAPMPPALDLDPRSLIRLRLCPFSPNRWLDIPGFPGNQLRHSPDFRRIRIRYRPKVAEPWRERTIPEAKRGRRTIRLRRHDGEHKSVNIARL